MGKNKICKENEKQKTDQKEIRQMKQQQKQKIRYYNIDEGLKIKKIKVKKIQTNRWYEYISYEIQIKNRNHRNSKLNKEMSIVLGVYPVIQLLILSSLMIMQANLTLHAITITLSTLAYFLVAFKNPGYFQGQIHDLPSIDDQIHNQQNAQQHVIKELDEEDDKSQVNPNDIRNHVPQKNQLNQQSHSPQPNPPQLNPQPINQSPKIPQEIPSPTPTPVQFQTKLIQSKFPKTSPQQLQKLTQIPSDHIEFKIKQSSNKQIPQRYCRICKTFQPNRVRHCHECEKCICTFDHHCPWMNNCIGQKNRSLFWLYLMVQFIEFLLVLIDIGVKAREVVVNEKRVYFFIAAILLVTVVAFLLLAFHTYLMLKNFTTWQFVRWDRISYLSIYLYTKSSPFSYGLVRNISDYFFPGKSCKQWKINPEFLMHNKKMEDENKLIQSTKSIPKIPDCKAKIMGRAQTERAIIGRGNY